MIDLAQARELQGLRKSQATTLLKAFDFENIFSRYGRYVIRGSYKHNLMLKPDIDGTIFTEDTSLTTVMELVHDLLGMDGIRRVAIEKRPLPGGSDSGQADGWILQIKSPYDGVKWNLDVYVIKPEESAGHDYLGETTYSAEQQDAMLLIKAQLTQMNRYPGSGKVKGSFASIDIYRAVIEDGVTTTEELLAWGETHDYYHKV